jgi:hypothetical protein
MSENKNKTLMRCLTLMLMSLALVLFLKDSTRALFVPSQVTQDDTQILRLAQVNPDGAPLRIINTFVETPSPEKIVVRVMVQNQSDKKIRALAISAKTRIEFLNLTGSAAAILPTQVRTFDLVYTTENPKTISVSIDFVEFADGTTWGLDIGNSRDRLAGQRAGAKTERQRLKDLFKSKGQSGLIDVLEGDDSDESESLNSSNFANRSSQWLQGYHSGVMSIRYRVRRALQSGLDRVKVELDSPYDTSEDDKQ